MSTKPVAPNPSPIAVTMGDPSGISAEISFGAWRILKNDIDCCFFVLSRASLFEQIGDCYEVISSPEEAVSVFSQAMPILELPCEVKALAGHPDTGNAQMTLYSISKAVDLIHQNRASSIVTTPINKHVLYQAGFKFPGHTEFLAQLAVEKWKIETSHAFMMLVSQCLKTVPLTIHIALSQLPRHIRKTEIIRTCQIMSRDLRKYFGLSNPHIAVAGLNPHAGENGTMGKEEIEIIIPALRELKEMGVNVTGPYPADTLFHEKVRKTYDVVLGMYHDQALIPLKTLGFDEGVNTTLGLPFVRTSPDHGTAYDIAGKGLANPQSLIEAIRLARSMSVHARELGVNG